MGNGRKIKRLKEPVGDGKLRIGIDLMGGDRSPAALFEAVAWATQRFPRVHLTVFITQAALGDVRASSACFSSLDSAQVEFQIISDVIEMHDEPLLAIRKKKGSSLVLGLSLLKNQYLDAFVSAGNTGALIAAAALSLSLLPGVKRPALLAVLPTETGTVAVIDVGGNVSCTASHLVQFAQLGAAYQQCIGAVTRPRIGLLNIGIESKKGTSEVRQAYHLLHDLAPKEDMQFVGNLEGNQIFRGLADVLVTDGFTGNVLLKTAEGLSSFILQHFAQVLQQVELGSQACLLDDLHKQFHGEMYPGALICGVEGVAIKCHGESSAKGLFRGICGAVNLAENNFIRRLRRKLETMKIGS